MKTNRNAARHKEREKTQAKKPPRQPDLAVVIRDLNVAWPREAVEAETAKLTDQKKADLRQHLPNLMEKFQWVADHIGLKSAAAVDKASCADQPSFFGSN